jgi:hypothetical protein
MNEEVKNMQAPQMEMPTAEQIAAHKLHRANMIKSYREELSDLKVEAAYFELQVRIEKARFETWQWRIRFDQMMAPPPEAQGESINKAPVATDHPTKTEEIGKDTRSEAKEEVKETE